MSPSEYLLVALAFYGHALVWLSLDNRLHAAAIPRPVIATLTLAIKGVLIAVPAAYAMITLQSAALTHRGWLIYGVPCSVAAVYRLMVLGQTRLLRRRGGSVVLSDKATHLDIGAGLARRPVGDLRTDLLTRLPGNQVLKLSIHEKQLRLARLAPALDGLSIAHLSDLHMSGRIDRPYFEEIVARTNDLQPDLIAITGDLFDDDDCLAWIPRTLERLQAPLGVYFIFGNHDLRVQTDRARAMLIDAGLQNLGGGWCEIEHLGHPLLLAGNELPWIRPAADVTRYVCSGPETPLRVLLAHSPDQVHWAKRFDFDLMLAGHTHGGQIRLPLLGPVVAPSRMGTRYAAGAFHLDPLVMHVSRGVSAMTPLRWNCSPELALLRLRSAAVVNARRAPLAAALS